MSLSRPECWNGVLTWWSCCPWPVASNPTKGNSRCWFGQFSFWYCCGETPPSAFPAIRAELRTRRGDPLDCSGDTFEAWDSYFGVLSSFGEALRQTEPHDGVRNKLWLAQIPHLVETTEFLVNTYRQVLWHPLTKRHLLSAPLAALEERHSIEAGGDNRLETLAIAGFCYYGFFMAVLTKIIYTWLGRGGWTELGEEEFESTLVAFRTWVPVAELLDFWGESRWAKPFGRGDLLLELVRAKLQGAPVKTVSRTGRAWLPTISRYISNDSIAISSHPGNNLNAMSRSIVNKSAIKLASLPEASDYRNIEIAFSAFETERRSFETSLIPLRTSTCSTNKSLGDLPVGWRTIPLTFTALALHNRDLRLPEFMSLTSVVTVWSNHYGDALEVVGLLKLATPVDVTTSFTWHFAGLEHPGGRAGEQLRKRVCITLGRCYKVPIMSSLYLRDVSFSSDREGSSKAAQTDSESGVHAFHEIEKYYSYEISVLRMQVMSDLSLGPLSDLILCSTPFLACALLATILQTGRKQRMLVHLHFPPLSNVLYPSPLLDVLKYMVFMPSNASASLFTSVLCGAPLDCAQLTCLLGADTTNQLMFVPPVAAYVDVKSSTPRLSDTALVWRIHHFLGDWAWDLVSLWPALLERNVPWERSEAVKLQFFGVERGQVRTQAFYDWADIVDFLSVILLPWDFTLKTFDELFALQVLKMIPIWSN